MVFSHSGGLCLGGLDTDEFICQLLCTRLNIIVVSVAYRLAPEATYATSIFDVYDVLKWACSLLCGPSPLARANSAGSLLQMQNLSAVTFAKDS
jgi:acetyl esterase